MRKTLSFVLLLPLLSLQAQKSCFENAVEYRSVYLNQTSIPFDTLMFHMKKSEQMIVGCSFPNDTFTTLTNKHMALDNLKGKIRVVNFWSVYCAPCINEIPSFTALQKKYKDLVVLAFTLDKKKEVAGFLKQHSFNAQIVPEAGDFVNKYALGNGYPFTVVIDKAGKIIYVKSGGETDKERQLDLFNELQPVIDASLQKKK